MQGGGWWPSGPSMWRSSRSFRGGSLGEIAVRLVGDFGFAFFVVAVVVFTIIAATYQPEDPLIHPSSFRLTNFLSSTSNATFLSIHDSAALTGEDLLLPPTESIAVGAVVESDAVLDDDSTIPYNDSSTAVSSTEKRDSDSDSLLSCLLPVECSDAEVVKAMRRSVMERFPDLRFNRFGKAIAVPEASIAAIDSNSVVCDMAWRFRPKDTKRVSFYKDYRRFTVGRSSDCAAVVVSSIGDYHSGIKARKQKKSRRRSNRSGSPTPPVALAVPEVGEVVNDALPVVESESAFSRGRYLIYSGGGDRCKSMNHYLWSFLCSLGEAQYLNRTLVMDLSLCLSSMYTQSEQDEDGKDFRFYFDFEHLRDSALVLDQSQFWTDWNQWQKKDGLTLHLVEDFLVTPMKLSGVKDVLIMRKFAAVEPDNYWYRVCEGETESVVQRPWNLIWKSPRLMDIVSRIASEMKWDFDSVHVIRGDKAKNTKLWPNLAVDTSPESILTKLNDRIERGRRLYVATNEPDVSLFDPLKDRYDTHFLEDFKELWDEKSEWYSETTKLNNGVPVEFDGYMKAQVDAEVFLRGKQQIETFNDLTSDCKDGINSCISAS